MISSRDRVENAINHRKIDRIPRDLGGIISGISKIAYERLLNYMNIQISFNSIKISDRVQQLAQIDEKVLLKFKIDCRHIRAKSSGIDSSSNSFIDNYGIKFQKFGTREFPILYYEMVSYPLKAARTIDDIKTYNWPSPNPEWFLGCKKEAKAYWEDGYAVIADPLSGGILEQTIWLRGFNQFLHDIYERRNIVEELLDQNLFNQINIWEDWLGEIGEWSTIVLYGDDYGSQDRCLLHPNMWRELVKPRVKELIREIKNQYPHIKVQLHSCGSIEPIISDLIEIGIDILNPVQPRAKGMNQDMLKKKYGSKLCFHGGFDIQEVLPRGTSTEIEKEVKRVVRSLARDNTGYIFATAHNILADVPPENILQMYKTLSEIDKV